MKIAILFANGTEEMEALFPVDVLRRANVVCDIVSINSKAPTGSHNISVNCDKLIEEINFLDYDGVVIPGGMPGATNISSNSRAIDFITTLNNNGKLIASICASPAVVLAKHNLIGDRRATCFPFIDFISALKDCYIDEDVVVSKNLITANGPKSALKFALKICEYLKVLPKI